jgi:hypothetical protein
VRLVSFEADECSGLTGAVHFKNVGYKGVVLLFPAVLKRTRPLDRRQREGATMFHGGHYGPAAPCDCGLFNARGARPQLGLAFRCEVGCHESARYGCGKLHPTKVGPCLIALSLCSAYLIAPDGVSHKADRCSDATSARATHTGKRRARDSGWNCVFVTLMTSRCCSTPIALGPALASV